MERANEKFKEYYDTLERRAKIEFKKKVCNACYKAWPTIENWLHGKCGIDPLAQEKIALVVGWNIFAETAEATEAAPADITMADLMKSVEVYNH